MIHLIPPLERQEIIISVRGLGDMSVKERDCYFSGCLLPSICPQARPWMSWLGICLHKINVVMGQLISRQNYVWAVT